MSQSAGRSGGGTVPVRGPVRTKRISAQQRRTLLVKAAVEVIAEHGVEGATTRRIAEAAGASLASLHYAFDSKEALLFAIWEEQVRALESRALASARQDGLGPTAARLLRETFVWFQADEHYAQVQLELTFWALRQDAALGVGTYDLHIGVMRTALQAGRLAQESADRVESLARLVVAMSDGISVQWFCYRDKVRLTEDLDAGAAALMAFANA